MKAVKRKITDMTVDELKDVIHEAIAEDIRTAIRKMTALPAEKFGIAKRGRIRKDYFADIAVIDLNKLKSQATFENPRQYSDGIKHLLVNGVISIEDGKATGQRAGRALRRG